MKPLLKSLLESKKAAATLVAILVWVIGRFGLDVPAEELGPLVAAIATFVLAQGFADKGKEAVKIDNAHTMDLLAKEAGEPDFAKDE